MHTNIISIKLYSIKNSKVKEVCKAWSVVWVETLWSLWTMRNHMLFKGGVLSFEEILDNLRLKIMVVVTIQA